MNVEAVIDGLEALREDRDRLMRAKHCSLCQAPAGEPCRGADGATCRYHKGRRDFYLRLHNSILPKSWRSDLRNGFRSHRRMVEREVRASPLYEFAVRHGAVGVVE